jgi:hypothetical protein
MNVTWLFSVLTTVTCDDGSVCSCGDSFSFDMCSSRCGYCHASCLFLCVLTLVSTRPLCHVTAVHRYRHTCRETGLQSLTLVSEHTGGGVRQGCIGSKTSSTLTPFHLVVVTVASPDTPVLDQGVQHSDRDSIEHVLVEEEESTECVLMPTDCDEALDSEWVSADEGSYISLSNIQ